MAQRTIRVIMNGVTGRMGYRQHLVRSILAIRADGGVALPDGNRVSVEPILVGRNTEKLAALAAEHDVADFTTNLDEALGDASTSVYFDAQVTSERKKSILKAIGAGKHIYTEKPIAESVEEGVELVTAAREAGVINCRPSARAGTIGPRMAGASCSTCSRIGITYSRTSSASCRP